MPFCNECGKEYPEGAKFCQECGRQVSEEIDVVELEPEVKANKKSKLETLETIGQGMQGCGCLLTLLITEIAPESPYRACPALAVGVSKFHLLSLSCSFCKSLRGRRNECSNICPVQQ